MDKRLKDYLLRQKPTKVDDSIMESLEADMKLAVAEIVELQKQREIQAAEIRARATLLF